MKKQKIDNRPWEVVKKDDDTVKPIICWYEETANKLIGMLGKGYKKRKRVIQK